MARRPRGVELRRQRVRPRTTACRRRSRAQRRGRRAGARSAASGGVMALPQRLARAERGQLHVWRVGARTRPVASPQERSTRKTAAALVIVWLPTVAFTCGNRLPVVVKTLDRPIGLRSTWEDGQSVDDSIGPSVRAFLSSPPHHPVEVVISPPGGESFIATRDGAPELLGGPVEGPVVGWKVTPAGVQPLGLEELLSPGTAPAPGYALRAAIPLTRRRDGIE